MTSTRSAARAARRRETFRRTTKPVDPRNRLGTLLIAFVIVGAGLMAVLVDLQTVRPDHLRSLGEDQRIRTLQLAGYRGAVVDRNGFALASSTPSHQIVADPTMVPDPVATAAVLAPILGIDSATLASLLKPSSEDDHYSLLARNVDDEAVLQIQELESAGAHEGQLAGIFIRPEEDRIYPAGDLATAVVGRVDPDERGIYGVEHLYDEVMTGVPGTEQFERGRFGSITVGDHTIDPATAGYDVVLTLDHRIQYMAEQALADHCATTGAKGATVVMSDPRTGEILVMASVVRDEELASNIDDGDDSNNGRCVIPNYSPALVDAFEPGSVMKPLVVAAAMEDLGYGADTLVEVAPSITIGNKTFRDDPTHAAAPFPVWQILSQSMNVGAITLAGQIGPDALYNHLVGFGLGQPSGLHLTDGEASGLLRLPSEWYGADAGSIPIGQGVTVNALQLTSAYNVIANGGDYVAPVLVSSITDAEGTSHPAELVPPRPVLSEQTTAELTSALVAVISEGTGTRAAIDGYDVAGKTGTAWKTFDDGTGTITYGEPGNRRYTVTFAGFLPADDPQLTMVVVVDEPQTLAPTAGAVAAPIFAEIASYGARVLGIAPTELVGDGDLVRSEPASPLALPVQPVEAVQ